MVKNCEGDKLKTKNLVGVINNNRVNLLLFFFLFQIIGKRNKLKKNTHIIN